MRERRKWLWFVSLVVLGWAAFQAFTDDHGEFSSPEGIDHALYRLDRGFSNTAEWIVGGVKETNRESQEVFDGRMDRNDQRIERDRGAD